MPQSLEQLLAAAQAQVGQLHSPHPGKPRPLEELLAEVEAKLDRPPAPSRPDYDQLVPPLPDNPTPAQVALQRQAAHRLFMESVALPSRRQGRCYGR